MKLHRILILVLIGLFGLVQSCKDDEILDRTSASASFKLYQPTPSTVTLFEKVSVEPDLNLINNPAVNLVWDNTLGGSNSYIVEMSTFGNFDLPRKLATTENNWYTLKVGELNTILLQAGVKPYTETTVFFRITSTNGSINYISNTISLKVSAYNVNKPVITSPSAGSSFILNGKTPDNTATKVTWTDTASGGTVTYKVEVSKDGTTWNPAGQVDNALMLDWKMKDLNAAALKAGLVSNVAGDLWVRVTSVSTSKGGTITLVSEPVKISVTPYVAFKNLFLVGDATEAGWNNNNNNTPLFRDPTDVNKFTFKGYFNAGAFKLLEERGKWQPQWGLRAGVVDVNDGSTSDPDTFNIPSAGYYSFEINISTKTHSITPIDGTIFPTYSTIGYIGSATPGGWGADTDLTVSSINPHLWYVSSATLTAAEMKFRANNDWGVNWGANTPISGIGTPNGPNIPIEEAGTYEIWFNDIDGAYQLIKK